MTDLPNWLPYTFSFLFGFLVVLFVSIDTFNRPSYRKSERGLYRKFSPRHVTSNRLYGRALLLYLLVMELVFVGVGLFTDLGVLFFQDAESKAIFGKLANTPSYPLFAATVVVGLQNAWIFRDFEQQLRAHLHRLAKIPEGVQSTVAALRRSAFSYDAYVEALRRGEPEFRTLTTERLLNIDETLDRRWSKICCIVYALRRVRDGQTVADGGFDYTCFDEHFFEEYAGEYQEIRDLHRALAVAYDRMKEMEESAGMAEGSLDSTRQTILDDLERMRDRLYNFVACAVRSKKSSESEVVTALNKMGFRLPRIDKTPLDVMSVIYTVSGLAILTLGFAELARVVFAGPTTEEWRTIIPYVPNSFADAVRWLIATFLCHGTAALVALSFRIRHVRRNTWENLDADRLGHPDGRYLQGALLGAAGGYVALMAFALLPPGLGYLAGATEAATLQAVLQRSLVPSLAWLPVFFLTAGSILYYRDTRPPELTAKRRIGYVALQSVLGGVVGFISARLYTDLYHLYRGTISPIDYQSVDGTFHLMVAGLLACFGAWIAFYFPARRVWLMKRVYNWVGDWEAEQRDGSWIRLSLREDGGAELFANGSLEGRWEMISDKIRVLLGDGRRMLLLREDNHVRLLSFPRGRSIAAEPGDIWDVEKRGPEIVRETGYLGRESYPRPVVGMRGRVESGGQPRVVP